MNWRKFAVPFLAAFFGGVVVMFADYYIYKDKYVRFANSPQTETKLVSLATVPTELDFTGIAEKAVEAVVHVKTIYQNEASYGNPLLDYFFGGGNHYSQQPTMSTGSGVIIADNGYIITNNHVIDNSDKIVVVLNDKREFDAKLIGTDPNTDIALLKIEEKNLPFLKQGNSDILKVGEWVLAVGNPFNLTSTVTAGIVSAKGRKINVNENRSTIESFIQTDAAVNPGNSGGALINTNGEVIGINTAIASKTGSFVGYSFAVPIELAMKVVKDLIEFGEVQRAVLGVSITDIDAEAAKNLGLSKIEGVLVQDVVDGGSADKAGLKGGDIILKINSIAIKSVAELQEQIGRYRPGQKVDITINKDGKISLASVTLQNAQGTTSLMKSSAMSALGASFEPVSRAEKQYLGLKNGVKISKLKDGKLLRAGVHEAFIITQVNRQPVASPEELMVILSKSKGAVMIGGVYPNGMTAYYSFVMNN
jgi:serine protease Do